MTTGAISRRALLRRLDDRVDVLVIGGGATGLGAALDAVTRGYATTLVEAADFAGATSSRSTKLAHGGVRYLANGNVALVREALHERARMRANAPHLVDALEFVLPLYARAQIPYYFAGLKAYDALAGRSDFAASGFVGRARTLAASPDVRPHGLVGAMRYVDGRFDDARFALALARSAIDRGATVLNYVRATQFVYAEGRCAGALVRDEETGDVHEIRARVVINATGIFVDDLRRWDDPRATPLLQHSRGSHLVFPRAVFRGERALLVPRTADGRVLFAIPWFDRIVAGTTDIPVAGAASVVVPTIDEAEFIVAQLNAYLLQPVRRQDAVAAFAGLRPLVRGTAARTAQLSREHAIAVSQRGVVTVTGGKWTTYRKMAEDTIDVAAREARLAPSPSATAELRLHGSPDATDIRTGAYARYGTDAGELRALEREDPLLARALDPRLPVRAAEVVYAARCEYARNVEDVLARRTRASLLDSRAARAAAAPVATLLARELGFDDAWVATQTAAFQRTADDESAAIR